MFFSKPHTHTKQTITIIIKIKKKKIESRSDVGIIVVVVGLCVFKGNLRNRWVCDFIFFFFFFMVGLDCVSIRFRATYVQTCQNPGRAGARPCSWGCCPRRAGGCCARWSRPPSGLCGSHSHWAVIAERTDKTQYARTNTHTQMKNRIFGCLFLNNLRRKKK